MDSSVLFASNCVSSPGNSEAMGPLSISFESGVIKTVEPLEPLRHDLELHNNSPLKPLLVLPALTNAHDHARSLKSSTLGAYARPLESWLPMMALLPPIDPYLVAANSFVRALRGGVTALMVHYTRVQGGMPFEEEVLRVAKAAKDVGIQIGFAVSVRDQNGVAYAPDEQVKLAISPHIRDSIFSRFTATSINPKQYVQSVVDLSVSLKSHGLDESATIQMGPTGVQWCSKALLESIADASAIYSMPVHMHLLESRYQRVWADKEYPKGILNYLDDLGLLSPRLTLAHCTWASPEELDLLAQREVTIAVNASSNLHLRSGVANVREMITKGCRVAMGLDGMGLDEDDDALRELRLNSLLHSGWGFKEEVSLSQWWEFASQRGRRSIVGSLKDTLTPAGKIEPGYAADLICLDVDSLDDEAGVVPDVELIHKVMGRAHKGHIERIYAKGNIVLDQGQIRGVNEKELKAEFLDAFRSSIAKNNNWLEFQKDLKLLHHDLLRFYDATHWLGCQ